MLKDSTELFTEGEMMTTVSPHGCYSRRQVSLGLMLSFRCILFQYVAREEDTASFVHRLEFDYDAHLFSCFESAQKQRYARLMSRTLSGYPTCAALFHLEHGRIPVKPFSMGFILM